MKITIDLNEAEVKALKAYLKEVSPDVNPVITKEDIKQEVAGMVSGCLQVGSLGDHYKQATRGLGLSDNSNASDNGYDDY